MAKKSLNNYLYSNGTKKQQQKKKECELLETEEQI